MSGISVDGQIFQLFRTLRHHCILLIFDMALALFGVLVILVSILSSRNSSFFWNFNGLLPWFKRFVQKMSPLWWSYGKYWKRNYWALWSLRSNLFMKLTGSLGSLYSVVQTLLWGFSIVLKTCIQNKTFEKPPFMAHTYE